MSKYNASPVAPTWAPRVSKEGIRRLYEDDANGFYDPDFINQIAIDLLMRCQSMLIAEDARNGKALCPVCGKLIDHDAKKGTMLECPYCSWKGSWDAYRASMDGLHLIAPGLIPFLIKYNKNMTDQLSLKEKVYWIDWLVHRVHWEGTALHGQPGAVCLIQGRASDVNAFLTGLTTGKPARPQVELSALWSGDEIKHAEDRQKAAQKRRNNRNRSL